MWRRLRRGELDHEALWLGVSLAALLLAWAWVRLGFASPLCPFHELTGWACPSCGATRCVRYALRGAFHAAFLVNPLVFAALAGIVVFDFYAATVLALRLPRLRLAKIPARIAMSLRAGCVGLLLVNWLWLLHTRV